MTLICLICLKINGKQTVKLKSGSIKLKIYHKQPVPFKVYADFECNVKQLRVVIKVVTEVVMLHAPKNIKQIFLAVLLIEENNAVYRFIKAIFDECKYCKKVIKKHFNKNLVMSAEDEKRFP